MAPDTQEEDVIDLKKLIVMVFGYYRIFCVVMVVCAALLVGVNAWKSKYHVEGFFAFDDISFPVYKKYMTEIMDTTRLTIYLQELGLSGTMGVEKLYYAMSDPQEFDRMIEPMFAYTKTDVKKFGIERYGSQAEGQGQKKLEPSGVLGIAMHFKGEHLEVERKLMELMADLMTDRMLYLDLSTLINGRILSAKAGLISSEQAILKNKSERVDLLDRISDLKRLLRLYPDAAKFDVRQVVSVDANGARYLSPLAQLVAAETQVQDIDIKASALQKDFEMNRVYLDYFTKIKAALDKNTTSRNYIPAIKRVTSLTMKEYAANDVIRLSVAATDMELEGLRVRYKEKFHFSSGPTSPSSKAGKFLLTDVLGFGALAGFLVTLLIVLTRLWWFELLPQKRVQIPRGG